MYFITMACQEKRNRTKDVLTTRAVYSEWILQGFFPQAKGYTIYICHSATNLGLLVPDFFMKPLMNSFAPMAFLVP